ncbi:hypothetical protein ACFQ2P_04800 [Levilactobacillus namurensis]
MTMLQLGIVIFAVGFVLTGLATVTFKLRALANKPAWGGLTVPSGIVGVVALIIGVGLIGLTRM